MGNENWARSRQMRRLWMTATFDNFPQVHVALKFRISAFRISFYSREVIHVITFFLFPKINVLLKRDFVIIHVDSRCGDPVTRNNARLQLCYSLDPSSLLQVLQDRRLVPVLLPLSL